MKPLPEFPTEILNQIFGHLACADLAALCRVHPEFRHIAEALLYNSIELSWTKKKNPPVVPLLRSILSRPQLASHVRHLKLVGSDFYLTSPSTPRDLRYLPLKVAIAPDEQTFLTNAIGGLPLDYVSSWAEELRVGAVDALVALLLKSVPNLRSLCMESNFTREARFVGNLFRSALCDPSCADLPNFGDLRDVVFRSWHTEYRWIYFPHGNTNDVLPFFYLPAARSLDLFIDTPPSGIFDWPAKSPDLSNLTSLSLWMLRESSLGKILSATPCLKSLRWEWHYGTSYSSLPWGQTIDLDHVASALDHVRDTLESLHIKAWADYGAPSNIELDPLEIQGTLRPVATFPKVRHLEAPWAFVVGFTPDTTLRLEDIIPSSVESLVLEASLMAIDAWEWEDYEMIELFPQFFESRRAAGRQLRELEMVVPVGGASTEWGKRSIAPPRLAEICSTYSVELKITERRL